MGLGLMTGHIKALLCLLLVVSVHELGHAALAVFFRGALNASFCSLSAGRLRWRSTETGRLKRNSRSSWRARFSMCGFRRQPGSFSCQALQVSRHLRCLPFIISPFFSSIFCRSGRLTAESSCFYTSLNKWLFKSASPQPADIGRFRAFALLLDCAGSPPSGQRMGAVRLSRRFFMG